jgi:flagellar hook-associated protein 2
MSSTGTISSGTGLISGLDYATLISNLMALAKKPYDALKTRNTTLTTKQTSYSTLMGLMYSVKYISNNLGDSSLFNKQTATSSNSSILSATVTGAPAVGTYTFTALQTAAGDQYLSGRYSSKMEAVGAGTLSLSYGDGVERAATLDSLSGGNVFSGGKITITDRSGAKATIDLSAAQTIDDVLAAINNADGIEVTAAAVGDHIHLDDHTGQAVSNLKVQDVGSGTAAAILGLAGINAHADSADGTDVVKLADDTLLSDLNDGQGAYFDSISADISYTLRDGTTGQIDFDPRSGAIVTKQYTLGEAIDKISSDSGGKITAAISSDGSRLVLTDHTTGSGTFALSTYTKSDSEAIKDLGLDQTAVDGVITGRRIMGGLKSVLLSSLNGGRGFGTLGSVNITDRTGAGAAVNLAGTETLEDVIDALNGSGLAIEAAVNAAGNGIVVTDTSGSTDHNLTIAGAAADSLKIAVDGAVTGVNSGNLNLQSVGLGTKLSALNGGSGIARGKITVTNSLNTSETVNLNDSGIETVGDLIRAVNLTALHVTAQINATGDGIKIVDNNGGTSTLRVADVDSTSAADLNLLGAATKAGEIQTLDGAMTRTVTLSGSDTLQTLSDKINALNMGLSASILSDGSGRPYRLQVTTDATGSQARLQIDGSGSALDLEQSVEAQDALLQFGASRLTSSTNTFTSAIDGVSLTVGGVSGAAVTVSVARSSGNVKTILQSFVDNYNAFIKQYNADTAYNSDTDTAGTLVGDTAALSVEAQLARLIGGRFSETGTITSLTQLGIAFDTTKNDGTLKFNGDTFDAIQQSNPDAVNQFFTTADTGFSDKMNALIEKLAGNDNSLLENQSQALQSTIDRNSDRMEALQTMLDKEQSRLETQFANLELALSKMQSSLSYLDSISWITDNNNSNSLFSS